MAHRIVSRLAVLAVLASLPAAALAREGDRDQGPRPGPGPEYRIPEHPRGPVIAPGPVRTVPAPAAPGWGHRDDRRDPAGCRREALRRDRERRGEHERRRAGPDRVASWTGGPSRR